MIRRVLVWAVVGWLSATAAWAADVKDPLVRARMLYNDGQFDDAIVAADEARKDALKAGSADLIAARAYLERYRTAAAEIDLATARERLRRVDAERFTASERLEFLVGVGQTLYFDGSSGASALVFASVLDAPVELPAEGRERVLDWWATALDRDSRPRPDIERQGVYQRIRDRMALELAAGPGNASALYWAAAAARAQGDLQAAWDAAQAAWVRAILAGGRAARLRTDLEELVTRAIIPERARVLGAPAETLSADWSAFKQKWN